MNRKNLINHNGNIVMFFFLDRQQNVHVWFFYM